MQRYTVHIQCTVYTVQYLFGFCLHITVSGTVPVTRHIALPLLQSLELSKPHMQFMIETAALAYCFRDSSSLLTKLIFAKKIQFLTLA